MLRVAVDTNVWVSSQIATGNAYAIKKKFEEGAFQLYLAIEMLDELREVLARDKLAHLITKQSVKELLELIEDVGIFIQLPKKVKAVSRDPDDDIYLACVHAAHCHYLVTGDDDLLTLKKYKHTHIVTPAQFLKVIENY